LYRGRNNKTIAAAMKILVHIVSVMSRRWAVHLVKVACKSVSFKFPNNYGVVLKVGAWFGPASVARAAGRSIQPAVYE
jgi:hypothetical protein